VARPRERELPAIPHAEDPDGLGAWAVRYLEWLQARHFSWGTTRARAYQLREFVTWCQDRDLVRPSEVTRQILDRYQRWTFHVRRGERPLSCHTQHGRLLAVKLLFRWLTRGGHLEHNPASELDLPRLGKRLPRAVLTAEEAEAVLAQPDPSEALGLRDRAILEVFYSSGLRRMELIGLELQDLQPAQGTLMVREGKGRKDRVVPIGSRALEWVDRYVTEARPAFVQEPDDGTLFLTVQGEPFSPSRLGELVREYVIASGVPKRGACHLFRHTMATLMLENGADVRFIQQLLGHAELSTTAIYTHVSIRKLKEVHEATHPAQLPVAGRARRRRPTTGAREELAQALEAESEE
jgi:integrase/recombinase XerD